MNCHKKGKWRYSWCNEKATMPRYDTVAFVRFYIRFLYKY